MKLERECQVEKSLVIIPTYNEKDNVVELVKLIFRQKGDFDVLFVDDDSPDGTAKIIEGLAKKNPNIKLLVRVGRKGYGRSCIDGFKYGLKHGYKFFLQMDADLSHDSRMIPLMIENAGDCDLVIGSRYIDGGRIVAEWSPYRKLISWGGSKFAKILLGLPVNDCTSGFRCYSNRAVKALNFNHIRSEGYSFLLEILYKCYMNGCNVRELPISYVDRRKGQSKLSRIVILEAFWFVVSMSVKKFFKSHKEATARD